MFVASGTLMSQMKYASSSHMRLPGVIVANSGQWSGDVLYGDMLGRYAFTRDGMIMAGNGLMKASSQVEAGETSCKGPEQPSIRFVKPSHSMTVHAAGRIEGPGNMYIGGDSSEWRTGLPVHSGVVYRNVWDSVDAEISEASGGMMLTVSMRPGAKYGDISLVSSSGDFDWMNGMMGADGMRMNVSRRMDGAALLRIIGSGDTVAHTTEFSTYIGEYGEDGISSLDVVSDGSIYISGYTKARGILPAGVGEGIFVMHLACDGRTIIYTTIYSPRDSIANLSPHEPDTPHMCIRNNGNAIVAGCIQSMFPYTIPITANAMEKKESNHGCDDAFFYELDAYGGLNYASLFNSNTRPGTRTYISSIALDSRDNLCMSGVCCADFMYYTPGTLDQTMSGSFMHFVVKLRPTLDSVIWGTRCGAYPIGEGETKLLTLDKQDNLIVLSACGGKDKIPLVNAMQTVKNDSVATLFIQKLTPNADSLIFSTYLAGTNCSLSRMTHPCIGPDNSIHIVGCVWSRSNRLSMESDFPIVNSRLNFKGFSDGFYIGLTPEGKIIRSFCLGGSSVDELVGMDFDKSGNMYLYGYSYSSDFPLVNPLVSAVGIGVPLNTLTVVNPDADSILFSTNWCEAVSSETGLGEIPLDVFRLRPTGYVCMAGTLRMGLPVFNARRSDPWCTDSMSLNDRRRDCHDGFLTRIFLPFTGQDFLRITMRMTDSLQLETSQNIILGGRFRVRVSVDNPSLKDTAYNPDMILRLPVGISHDSSFQSLVHHLTSPFPPGAHAEYEWTVRVDTITAMDSVFAIRAVVEYDLEPNPPSCERPYVRCAGYVPVHRYRSPDPEYTCTIEAPDSLSVSADSLIVNPFPVRCRIRNTGLSTYTLSGLRIVLPVGSPAGLELVPTGDSLRPGGTLAPGEEIVRDWTVKALFFPKTCERLIKLVVIDTFGYRLPGCEKPIVIPGLKRTVCTITATDTAAYNTTQAMYLPSPLNVDVTVSSDLDTTLAGVTARLDLSHASHLQLVTGDSLNRSLPSISAHGSMGARWRLEVVPHPSGPVSDTLFVYHRAPGWSDERWCMHVMRIIPPLKDVSCSLDAPAVTVTAENGYSPDTAIVKWVVSNNGAIAMSGLTAHLDMSCDPAWRLDPPDLPVGIVQPSGRDSVTWRLVPKTSAFERDVTLRVTARDSLGAEITSCDAVLHLPRIYPPLRCTLTSPDTLRYVRQTDSYMPDPFNTSVIVENLVDTAMTASVHLDLTGSPHLRYAPGETGQATLGVVQPHATAQHAFNVGVLASTDQLSREDLSVTAEGLISSTTFESLCTSYTMMQARPGIHTAECFTAGHDTVWYDSVHEDIIPHPIQIRNGIINTGNEPLENCEAAIIVPDGYILTQPPDSIQKYAPIAPGDTGRKEWLLEVNADHPAPDPRTVRFVWHCDSGVQGECTRNVVLNASSPQGIVLSKWRLLFSAEMSTAVPSAQQVSVWTGGNAPFAWQAVPDVPWLSATPSVLGGSGTIEIVPTTTALPVGMYEGTVRIVTSEYARPVPIEVGYDIWIKSGAAPVPSPTGLWLECVPNPARPGGALRIRYAVEKPGAVRIRLVDALGREVNSEYREAISTNEQQTTLNLPPSLVPGAYFIVLDHTSGRVVKGVVVR
jgi:hypothetical protein